MVDNRLHDDAGDATSVSHSYVEEGERVTLDAGSQVVQHPTSSLPMSSSSDDKDRNQEIQEEEQKVFDERSGEREGNDDIVAAHGTSGTVTAAFGLLLAIPPRQPFMRIRQSVAARKTSNQDEKKKKPFSFRRDTTDKTHPSALLSTPPRSAEHLDMSVQKEKKKVGGECEEGVGWADVG